MGMVASQHGSGGLISVDSEFSLAHFGAPILGELGEISGIR
jgi:hypothetical protein